MKLRLPKNLVPRGTEAPPIGVDIGRSSIKVAQVTGSGAGRQVRVAGTVTNSGDVSAEDSPLRLKNFLRRSGIARPWHAVSALSGLEAEIRILKIQPGDRASFPARVMQAAERALPFGTEDTIIDFFSLGRPPEGDESKVRVLVAAAPREAVERHVTFLEAAGMVPEAVEMSPWPLARAVQFCGLTPSEGSYGILDLGHSSSTVVVFDQDQLLLSRSIRCGAKGLTERLSKELHLDRPRAEQLKGDRGLTLAAHTCRSGGCDAGGTLVAEILDDLLLPALEPLVEEVKKSLSYCTFETQGDALERLILCGGGARLQKLDLYLQDRLGLPVAVMMPTPEEPSSTPEGILDIQSWPVVAAAIGLSLREGSSR